MGFRVRSYLPREVIALEVLQVCRFEVAEYVLTFHSFFNSISCLYLNFFLVRAHISVEVTLSNKILWRSLQNKQRKTMALFGVSCLFPFLCLSSRNKSECLKSYSFLLWWSFWQKLKLFWVCGATEIMLSQLFFSWWLCLYFSWEEKLFYHIKSKQTKKIIFPCLKGKENRQLKKPDPF